MRPFALYCIHRFRRESEERAWREYVADSLNVAPQGRCLGKRWSEVSERRHVETRSGGEIVAEVIESAGLKVVREGTCST